MKWKPSNLKGRKYLGEVEVFNAVDDCEAFTVLATKTRIIFGGNCNVGFMESGYIERESYESTDETLQEMVEDLETYYRDGPSYTSRIVCNERM